MSDAVRCYSTGLKKCYFMVWPCHGFTVDEICFDSALWEYLK